MDSRYGRQHSRQKDEQGRGYDSNRSKVLGIGGKLETTYGSGLNFTVEELLFYDIAIAENKVRRKDAANTRRDQKREV